MSRNWEQVLRDDHPCIFFAVLFVTQVVMTAAILNFFFGK